jgi:glycosyltransferase involved in cell wall biosynthesis
MGNREDETVATLVSILVPAYNAEKWIAQTLRSAINQTWEKKEIIVVDDGSSDETFKVAKQFESKIVRVVTQENRGACGARNKARSLAQGDYIQWLDADDLLSPEKVSRQMGARGDEQNGLTLFTSAWGKFYFRHERASFIPDSLWCDLLPVDWIMTKFVEGVWMNPAAWLVSRRLSELAGLWDERISSSGDDDGEYLCRIVARSEKVKFVQEAKSYYRIGNVGSLSWRKSDQALKSFFTATCLCVDHLLSLEDSDRTRAACLELLRKRYRYFHMGSPEIIREANGVAQNLGGCLKSPPESWRFFLVRQVVGRELAMKFKDWAWIFEVLGRKNIDRLIDVLRSESWLRKKGTGV